MPQLKAEWAEALAPGIREWFSIGYANRPTLIPQLFNVLPSNSDSEYYHSFGAVSPAAWDDFKNTGSVPSVGFANGYKTTFTHSTFAVELPVQRELIEDNKYAQVSDYAGQLGDSAALKRELDAAGVFNNCSLATVLGGDGVPLTDASHPANPHYPATVQANEGTTVLSAAAVAAARLLMMAFTDDVGQIAGVVPDLLVVGPALEDTAKIITQTPTTPVSADNSVNPRYGMRHLVWPYITSATQWFLIDSIKMKQSLIWFDRVPVDIYRKQQDEAVFATWLARMRYSYGWRDWRWCFRGNS
jgi:phage major head subunit gpT-like protein